MSKLLLLRVYIPGSRPAANDSKKTIVLRRSNDEEFEIEEAVAMESQTIGERRSPDGDVAAVPLAVHQRGDGHIGDGDRGEDVGGVQEERRREGDGGGGGGGDHRGFEESDGGRGGV
ncbi:uncharacterized protein A4U43_C10F4880 [Asparagus officinalis]|uniref:SKP1 component POZ domain-containing protein n=1 Tax=Asparagus officinalis TaxID=4686 RepID=A0A5P1E0R2_ASPOF|nr:uncharacterized protein A4U43_C10F4880 [Asparagus officinalis]